MRPNFPCDNAQTHPLVHEAAHGELAFDEQGCPVSLRFRDRYFDSRDGLAESRFIFIDGNNLAERFSAATTGSTFRIGETGFGSGLNFLATVDHWLQHRSSGHLVYQSVERYPLSALQLKTILTRWPSLQPLTDRLLEVYCPQLDSISTYVFDDWNLTLRLVWKECAPGLLDFEAGIDAWFFDGFSPKVNPDMWSSELIQIAFSKSAPTATGTTFTAAGWVRRNFQAAGFRIEKRPGFGQKREHLYLGSRLNERQN